MPSILNPGSATDNASFTGAADGALTLQTGPYGAKINALAFDASGNATFAGTVSGTINPSNSLSFRNRIINGAMVIDQRNAGTSVTPTQGQYLVDRFNANLTQASKFTAQQNAGAITPPTGFSKYLGVTSTSAYSVLTGDIFALQQLIEGFNFADMAWGTASASAVTLSFRVYSSLTGTFGGSLTNSGNSRSYPFTYTIPTANTWTTISITIAGDTSGTWVGATNGIGLAIWFSLGAGATYSGTAGSWSSNTYTSATGATSVVGTNGATFYITGVQLEKGSVATSFDYRPFGTELALCQRYYEKSFAWDTAPSNGGGSSLSTNQGMWSGYVTNNFPWGGYIAFKVTKRTTPTFNAYGNSSGYWYANGGFQVNAFSFGSVDSNGGTISQQAVASLTLTAGHWAASAEL